MRARLHHLSPVALLVIIIAVLLAGALPAGEELVWITRSGGHYHRQSCRFAKNARPVPLSKAREQGLTPCAHCFDAKESAALAYTRVIQARVVGISDGDTVTVLEGKNRYKLRLSGIDAPESGQAYGRQAKALLSSLIFGKTVQVELIERDRYGRWVANIFDGGSWVNKAVIEAGYAWHYRDFSTSKELQAAENRARAAGRGLWQERSPQAPWNWRSERR